MTYVEAGVVTFLPPIWEIVNSTEALPAATLRGTTVVYFFLTKDIAIRYILLPALAGLDLGLRLNERRLGLKVRFLLNTIFNKLL